MCRRRAHAVLIRSVLHSATVRNWNVLVEKRKKAKSWKKQQYHFFHAINIQYLGRWWGHSTPNAEATPLWERHVDQWQAAALMNFGYDFTSDQCWSRISASADRTESAAACAVWRSFRRQHTALGYGMEVCMCAERRTVRPTYELINCHQKLILRT